MKVIDLLNKISNGEIKDRTMFKYKGVQHIYYDWGNGCSLNSLRQLNDNPLIHSQTINLLDEIELIEEEKKIELPEKIAIIPFEVQASEANNFKQVGKALNQIIDYLKYKEEKEREE